MQADPAIEDFSLDDELDRIDGLLPLWQRLGPEEAEARRAAACRQFLELVSEDARAGAPECAIERLLAVNLVVVKAAALDCLQRDPNTYGPSGQAFLRQGARLMDLCLRLAKTLSREQAARRREAREAEAATRAPTAPATETTAPLQEPQGLAPADPAADAPCGPAARPPWQRALDGGAQGEGPRSDRRGESAGPPGRAPPAAP